VTVVLLVLTSLSPVIARSNGSSVRFENDPAPLAGDGLVVTSNAGGKIAAAIYNGSGKRSRIADIPIRLTLADRKDCLRGGPIKESTDADGIARFSPVIDCQGFDFAFVAEVVDTPSTNSEHIATGTSTSFNVVPAFDCPPTGGCDRSDGGQHETTHARVTSKDGSKVLLGIGGPGPACSGYDTTSATVMFDVLGATERFTAIVTLEDPDKPSRQFKVCLESASGFKGLLKDCPSSPAVNADPCLVDKFRSSGDQVVIVSVPPGDPGLKL
jgi:hypothetical protein